MNSKESATTYITKATAVQKAILVYLHDLSEHTSNGGGHVSFTMKGIGEAIEHRPYEPYYTLTRDGAIKQLSREDKPDSQAPVVQAFIPESVRLALEDLSYDFRSLVAEVKANVRTVVRHDYASPIPISILNTRSARVRDLNNNNRRVLAYFVDLCLASPHYETGPIQLKELRRTFKSTHHSLKSVITNLVSKKLLIKTAVPGTHTRIYSINPTVLRSIASFKKPEAAITPKTVNKPAVVTKQVPVVQRSSLLQRLKSSIVIRFLTTPIVALAFAMAAGALIYTR